MVPYEKEITIAKVLCCLNVLHLRAIYYEFSKEAFEIANSVIKEFDRIAYSNEVDTPFISYVYGKSKTHFYRITGCLMALENAFKILKQLKPIPENKDDFVQAVTEKIEENQPEITSSVVETAKMVTDYFIAHMFILAGIERVKGTDFFKPLTFTVSDPGSVDESSVDSNSAPGTSTSFFSLKKKIERNLECIILSTPGSIVYLTPLSLSISSCKKSTFEAACSQLQAKNLGKRGNFIANEQTNRKSSGFKKAPIPTEEESKLLFINSLFDFGVTETVYANSLLEESVPPPTPKMKKSKNKSPPKSTKSKKRLIATTSLQTINPNSSSKLSKQNKCQEEDIENEDDEAEEEEIDEEEEEGAEESEE